MPLEVNKKDVFPQTFLRRARFYFSQVNIVISEFLKHSIKQSRAILGEREAERSLVPARGWVVFSSKNYKTGNIRRAILNAPS